LLNLQQTATIETNSIDKNNVGNVILKSPCSIQQFELTQLITILPGAMFRK